MNCKRFEFLCRVVPFSPLRQFACRRHVDRCPECRQAFSNADELPPLLVTAEQLPAGIDLWPGIRAAITDSAPERSTDKGPLLPAPHFRRWALAMGIVFLLLAVGFWFINHGRQAERQPNPPIKRPALQTRVSSARVEDRPARVFLIQSRDPDRSIFWIAKEEPRS